MKNKFIVIEGIDGIGKDTIIKYLKEKYPDIHFTREPGGTEIGEDIRNILLHKEKNIRTEILLFGAMRSEHVSYIEEILKNKHVISSRYIYSSEYQRFISEQQPYYDLYIIDKINEFAINSFMPDIVISCYLENEDILMDRLNKSGREKDIIEQRGYSYYKYLNEYYKNLDSICNEYIYHLEMSGTIEENNKKVDKIIDLHLSLG